VALYTHDNPDPQLKKKDPFETPPIRRALPAASPKTRRDSRTFSFAAPLWTFGRVGSSESISISPNPRSLNSESMGRLDLESILLRLRRGLLDEWPLKRAHTCRRPGGGGRTVFPGFQLAPNPEGRGFVKRVFEGSFGVWGSARPHQRRVGQHAPGKPDSRVEGQTRTCSDHRLRRDGPEETTPGGGHLKRRLETAPWASTRPLETVPRSGPSKRRFDKAPGDGASERSLETALRQGPWRRRS